MREIVDSLSNKKFKLFKSLSAKKNRDKYGLYLIEGKRMTEEAVRYAKNYIEYILASRTFVEENSILIEKAEGMGVSVCVLKDNLFCQITNTVTPQGIAAVMQTRTTGFSDASNPENINKVLVLDGVSEPGNMGTIIRTAEAAGIDCIYMMKGCVDIYNPKVVRSTMGSLFRTRFLSDCEIDDLLNLKNNGFKIISSSLSDNSRDVYDCTETEKESNDEHKIAIVIGSEAFGVSKEVLNISDLCVHIPMQGKVESLNAAVAAGILMYILK